MSDDGDVMIRVTVEAENAVKTAKDLDKLAETLEIITNKATKLDPVFKAATQGIEQFGSSLRSRKIALEDAARSMGVLSTSAAALRKEYALLAAANPSASTFQLQGAFGQSKTQSIIDSERALGRDPVADAAAMRAANQVRGEGIATIRAEREANNALLPSFATLEAARRRLTEAIKQEIGPRNEARAANLAYKEAVRDHGRDSEQASMASQRHGQALKALAAAMSQTRTASVANTAAVKAEGQAREQAAAKAQAASQAAIRSEQEKSNAARRASDEYAQWWISSLDEVEARRARGDQARTSGHNAIAKQEYESLLASMTPVEAAQTRLTRATQDEATARARAAGASRDYINAVRDYGRNSQQASDAAVKHGEALQGVARAMGETRQMGQAYKTTLDQANEATRRSGVDAQGAATRFQSLQYALFYTSFMFNNLGGIGKSAIVDIFKATIDLEWQFAQVARTVDNFGAGTREEMKRLATEIPVTMEKIAEIGTLGGSLNVDSSIITNFTRTVAILAATTNLTEDAAGTLLGRMDALLDLNPDGSDFERIGAAVLDVGARSASTESQVAKMAAQLAGLGKNLKISAPDLIGWAGALASVGVSAELGRSSFQRIMNVINRNVRQGGAGLEILGQITSQTGAQFKKAIGEDASGALLSVVEGMRDLNARGGESIQVLNSLGIRNVRDVYAMQQLAAAYENTSRVIDIANNAYNNAGETMDSYYLPIVATTTARIEMMKSSWERLLDSMGSSTQGPLNDAIDLIARLLQEVTNFTQDFPWLSSTFIKGLALTAGALMLFGKAAQFGSMWANYMFVAQQLNTNAVPDWLKVRLKKIGILKADTAATVTNTAATTALGDANAVAGSKVSGFMGALGKGAKMLGVLLIILSLVDTFIHLSNAANDSGNNIERMFTQVGNGGPVVGTITQVAIAVLMGLSGIAEAAYSAVNAWKFFTGEIENDPIYQFIKTSQAGLYTALVSTTEGIYGQKEALEEAEEPAQQYGETLDDVGLAAAYAAGVGEELTESVEDVSSATLDAVKNMTAFVKSLSGAASSYLQLSGIVSRVEEAVKKAFGDDLPDDYEFNIGGNASKILEEWTGSNSEVQKFQENLAEIGRTGGISLANGIASMGVEQGGALAVALLGNPELQRQLQVQARITGLLANDAFVQAFAGGSDGGISDQVAIQMAELGASRAEIFGAIDASSFGALSDEWAAFVLNWNNDNPGLPIRLESFEFGTESTEAGGIAEQVQAIIDRELNNRPPMLPVELNLFSPELGSGTQADAIYALSTGLQSRLDDNTLSVPMALNEVAAVSGYESWQTMVEDNPALAEIDPWADDVSVRAVISRIQYLLRTADYVINIQGNFLGLGDTDPRRTSGGSFDSFGGRGGAWGKNARGGYIDGQGVGHFARGGGWGLIGGRGTGTSDSNLSWLSKGEYVQTAAATSHYGVPMMDAIRAKQFPTVDQFASMMRSAIAVSGNSGPQSVTNVSVTQNNPVTRDPLKMLRQDSENLVAGIWGRG